ncbi:MAG: translation elongation factor Ts [Acidimicrobiia bacterium]
MAEFGAKDVAALRKATGAGMMDAKKALEASGGDAEKAKDWLREKGLAGAGKRAGRAADQGAIDVVVAQNDAGGTTGALVELNCETDFVAKGADFKAAVIALAQHVVANGDENVAKQAYEGSTVEEFLVLLSAKLGEKIELGRVVRYETPDGLLDGYKHIQNDRGTIGVLVELGGVELGDGGAGDEKARAVAHDIALHVASAAPRYVTRDDVPADVVAKERGVLEALTRNEGKPEQALPKIIEGRLNGFYKDVALVEQGFVREPKTTVKQLLADLGPDATVRRFARVKIGEE